MFTVFQPLFLFCFVVEGVFFWLFSLYKFHIICVHLVLIYHIPHHFYVSCVLNHYILSVCYCTKILYHFTQSSGYCYMLHVRQNFGLLTMSVAENKETPVAFLGCGSPEISSAKGLSPGVALSAMHGQLIMPTQSRDFPRRIYYWRNPGRSMQSCMHLAYKNKFVLN